MVSHRRSAKERRAQRSRAEARLVGRILRGCLDLAVRKAGDVLCSLADNLRGRSPTKQESKEVYQQPDPDIFVAYWSRRQHRQRRRSPSAVESPVVLGTLACSVADVMQTEDQVLSDAICLLTKTLFFSAATDAEAWQAPPRRRKP